MRARCGADLVSVGQRKKSKTPPKKKRSVPTAFTFHASVQRSISNPNDCIKLKVQLETHDFDFGMYASAI